MGTAVELPALEEVALPPFMRVAETQLQDRVRTATGVGVTVLWGSTISNREGITFAALGPMNTVYGDTPGGQVGEDMASKVLVLNWRQVRWQLESFGFRLALWRSKNFSSGAPHHIVIHSDGDPTAWASKHWTVIK